MGRMRFALLLLLSIASPRLTAQDELGPAWKSQIVFPDDPFASWTSPSFVKFTIITKDGYDPNVIYFQDSSRYEYHYAFALEQLEPFLGMTIAEFDTVTLHQTGQQAVLGAVILPPWSDPAFQQYGIQLVRNDPYTREEIVALFQRVRACITADPNVTAYYFPSYEQYPVAEQNRAWFEAQGVPVGSTAQWIAGNIGYSSGWALGRLVFVSGTSIQAAYQSGALKSDDILLTDGVPAEVPSVAGILTLTPSTPNSHVAILARSQGVPFVHLAVADDVAAAHALVGRPVYLTVAASNSGSSCEVTLLDMNDLSTDDRAGLLKLKESAPLVIQPVAHDGRFWADTNDLTPADIACFGGKASNFSVLRRALPDNSPRALAFSFDLWTAFLTQPLAATTPLIIESGHKMLVWADAEPEQGPTHLGFKLSKSGESLGLFGADGTTLTDSLTFGAQQRDVSYGRVVDGAMTWQFFTTPTPGKSNDAQVASKSGLVINEFMADNATTLMDPDEAGEYPDWIELYNGTAEAITLNGLFLTDDLNEPARWQIPPVVTGSTLGDEITRRLSKYTAYPPADVKALSTDLAAIRSLFINPSITSFDSTLTPAVTNALTNFGFDLTQALRFRSSTNVEDSSQFTGAGLYESYSGTMADNSVFDAIRRVFASFYFDNAYLERLKHGLDESQVGMAVLTHASFPDEIELANGVATMKRTDGVHWSVDLVSQKGAVSVTNPPTDVIAERVGLEGGSWGVMAWIVQSSSLVALREATVLEWDREYLSLYDLFVKAADAYSQAVQKDDLMLDLEYKKIAPDNKLIIKQIRPVPQAGEAAFAEPFLWDQARVYCTLQGRGSDVFTNHRLKSRWTIKPKGLWLNAGNLSRCVYDEIQIEYAAEGEVHRIDAPPSQHTYDVVQGWYDSYSVSDSWSMTGLANARTCQLVTSPLFQETVSTPVVTLAHLRLIMEADYAHAVPTARSEAVTTEETSLYQPWEPGADEAPEVCSLSDPNTGVTIETQFYMHWGWGADAPTSIQFRQTRIEGLTTEPIVLTGYFSQSVGGGSHLCPKDFLFEPQLEPGISSQILDELKAKNVRFIFYTTGARECRPTERQDTPPYIRLYGFDAPFDSRAAAAKVPVYRFWSRTSGDHIYTSSESEKQKLTDMGEQKWVSEGIAWYALPNADEPNALPVYRFWSAALSSHFYTISESEKTKLMTQSSGTWAYEGVCFYAYAEAQRPADAVPIYRLWSRTLGKHFYTASATEKDKLIANPGTWASEGVAWYAYSP